MVQSFSKMFFNIANRKSICKFGSGAPVSKIFNNRPFLIMNAKKSYILLLIFIGGLAVLYFYNKYRVAPGIELARLQVTDERGSEFHIPDSIKGKKVILSFYASWCGDCLKELKNLDAAKNAELADVAVLAVTDESLDKLIAFKEKKQYPFTFLKLRQSFNELKVFSIPVVYLINAEGKIVYEHVGYVNWQDASTLNHMKSLLEE